MNVLVTYASAAGSTRGVADRLATRLRGHGHSVRCAPVDTELGAFGSDVVVVGSAVHGQAWLPIAADWLRSQSAVLPRDGIWAFSVGMPAAVARPLRRLAALEGPKIVAALTAVVPIRGHELFSGVVAPQTFAGRSRWAFRLMGCRYGDFRDWEAIDRYADRIAAASGADTGPAAREQA